MKFRGRLGESARRTPEALGTIVYRHCKTDGLRCELWRNEATNRARVQQGHGAKSARVEHACDTKYGATTERNGGKHSGVMGQIERESNMLAIRSMAQRQNEKGGKHSGVMGQIEHESKMLAIRSMAQRQNETGASIAESWSQESTSRTCL